ncbi:MAG: hypothetical protein GEU80_15580 [Dehalococcoidia bacterium]|nr:hypothetical protein [Dehalococcoidia bacterium]
MPFGEFLEDFPSVLFVLTHVAMVGIGVWAIVRTWARSPAISKALWLYLASQPVFFAFWAELITLKMAAVTEQALIILMVVWLVLGTGRAEPHGA